MNLLRRLLARLRPTPHYGGWQDFETGTYVTHPHDTIAAAFDIPTDLLGPRGAFVNAETEREAFLHGGAGHTLLPGWRDNSYAIRVGPRDPRLWNAGESALDDLRRWAGNARFRTPHEQAMDALDDVMATPVEMQPWQQEFIRRVAPDVYARLRSEGVIGGGQWLRVHIHNAVRAQADAMVYGIPIQMSPLVPRGELWVEDRNTPEAMPYRFTLDSNGDVVRKGWEE